MTNKEKMELQNIRKRLVAQREEIKKLTEEKPNIIYCTDCKYQVKVWHEYGRVKGGWYCYGCDMNEYAQLGYDDDYCSLGERKYEEGKVIENEN